MIDLDAILSAWVKSTELPDHDFSAVSVKLLGLNYEDISPTATPEVLVSESFENASQAEDTAAFSHTETTTASFTYAFAEGFQFSAKDTFTVGLPGIVSNSLEISAALNFSSTQSQTKTQSQTWKADQTVPVPKESCIEVSLVVYSEQYSPKFTATLLVIGDAVASGDSSGGGHVTSSRDSVPAAELIRLAGPSGVTYDMKDGHAQTATITLTGTFHGVFGSKQIVKVKQSKIGSSDIEREYVI